MSKTLDRELVSRVCILSLFVNARPGDRVRYEFGLRTPGERHENSYRRDSRTDQKRRMKAGEKP